jgi:exosome complex component RRP4
VGDVVVGRVVEVGDKRWRVDINSRQDAILQLSSIILPGGAQRRRTAEDSLQMRTFFTEGDLVSAEVQSVHHDGSLSLHTRSMKYGKLDGGQLVCVPQALIKRCKQHFLDLPTGVNMILGNNGYVWLSRSLTEAERAAKDARDKEEDQSKIEKVH